MVPILSTNGLPGPLADAMRPWIGVVETATFGMGEEVRNTAVSATLSLLRRIVLTPPLEDAIENARLATSSLASILDLNGPMPITARPDARDALEALIVWLRTAKPNERAKGLGLAW